MELKCPYCNGELIPGYIYSDKYSLRWFDVENSIYSALLPFTGQKISYRESGIGKSKVKSYKCTTCNKLIIDLNHSYKKEKTNIKNEFIQSNPINKSPKITSTTNHTTSNQDNINPTIQTDNSNYQSKFKNTINKVLELKNNNSNNINTLINSKNTSQENTQQPSNNTNSEVIALQKHLENEEKEKSSTKIIDNHQNINNEDEITEKLLDSMFSNSTNTTDKTKQLSSKTSEKNVLNSSIDVKDENNVKSTTKDKEKLNFNSSDKDKKIFSFINNDKNNNNFSSNNKDTNNSNSINKNNNKKNFNSTNKNKDKVKDKDKDKKNQNPSTNIADKSTQKSTNKITENKTTPKK